MPKDKGQQKPDKKKFCQVQEPYALCDIPIKVGNVLSNICQPILANAIYYH
jgi:hypothetical protein